MISWKFGGLKLHFFWDLRKFCFARITRIFYSGQVATCPYNKFTYFKLFFLIFSKDKMKVLLAQMETASFFVIAIAEIF